MVFKFKCGEKVFSRGKSYLNRTSTWVNIFKRCINRQATQCLHLKEISEGDANLCEAQAVVASVRSLSTWNYSLNNLFSKCLPFPFVFSSKLSLLLTLSPQACLSAQLFLASDRVSKSISHLSGFPTANTISPHSLLRGGRYTSPCM